MVGKPIALVSTRVTDARPIEYYETRIDKVEVEKVTILFRM